MPLEHNFIEGKYILNYELDSIFYVKKKKLIKQIMLSAKKKKNSFEVINSIG